MKRISLPALLALSACSGMQSAADEAGRHATITANLFTLFLVVSGIFFLAVLLFLGWAVRRHAHGPRERQDQEQALQVTTVVWIGAIMLGLLLLTAASYVADRQMAHTAPPGKPPLRIKLTAQQWWWEVQYQDPVPGNQFRTANELHLPVGTPVHIELQSDDVIHSFWVPNLAGKQDLIPGRTTDIALLPTRIGHYRGQCAEFCGLQHAHMALEVTVESPAAFAAWRARSIQPARPPATAQQQAGYAWFMKHQCAACHAISGTPAQATVGPDLSRVASRPTIAAGTLINNRGNLEAWIADPQRLKPGNHMPEIDIPPADLHALSAYLESLS